VLGDLGNVARDQKDQPTAQALYGQSIRMFNELDHKRGVARLLECLATAAAVQSRTDRALRLAGAAAALRETVGAPLTAIEQLALDRYLDPARQSLNGREGAQAWTEGWTMSMERAIDYALDPESNIPSRG